MPLYFDQFEFSNIPADWSMILVGWRGFASRKLSAAQVIALALEQIGKGTPEQDEIAALLANSDPTEWQTIDRYLEELAQTENRDRAQGLRKWRLAELKYLIEYVSGLDKIHEYPEDEAESIFFVFHDFWHDYDELPDSAAAQPDWAKPVDELLAEYQVWAEREEASLRDDRNKTHSVMEVHSAGHEALKDLDVQKYISEMRDKWDKTEQLQWLT